MIINKATNVFYYIFGNFYYDIDAQDSSFPWFVLGTNKLANYRYFFLKIFLYKYY